MRKSLAIVFFLLSSLAAFAAQPWDGPAFSSTPQAIRQAAAAVPTPAGANVHILFEQQRYRYEPDGRCVETYQMVYKVLTAAAVDDWSSTSVRWAPWHQQRPTIRARVIGPDTVHTLDPDAITESPVTEESEDIYSDERRLRAPFPGVVPGSIIEQEIVITDTAPHFAAGDVREMSFGNRVPTLLSRLVLDVPTATPLQYKVLLLKDIAIQKTSADGRNLVTFEVGAMDPLEDPEPAMPSDVVRWPQVRFSTGASWQAIAASYNKSLEAKLAGADVSAYVARLRSTRKDRHELIEAVVEQLHRDVRYTGIEFGESSIIPHTPEQVLKSRYGDCKDKSTLLVAMLRSIGIPAYVALLDAGPGSDVSVELPGLGMFDHAIVYVPGTPELWIDATSEFSRIDALEFADQGRLALIIRPETTGLVKTPELPSSADTLVERREVLLPENGPAQVIETSQPKGLSESDYRSWYGGADTKDVRKRLEDYVKDHYLAEKLGRLEHSPGNDMARPFELVLYAEKARRGYVEMESASVYIPTANLYNRLPEFITRKPERSSGPKQDEEDRRKQPAVIRPFVTEWRYHIVPPSGFAPRTVPPDSQRSFGPAVLTSHFEVAADSSVSAILRFDVTRSHWTAAEVETARKAIAEYSQMDLPAVHFDLAPALQLRDGKVREGLAAYERLTAMHPREALHHSQFAMGLLAVGLGEAARLEAKKATELEPGVARSWKTLGWVLQHDFLARRLTEGWDMAGSAAAYQKAIQLDPDLTAAVIDYAISLEHDQFGTRYADKTRLAKAIEQYRRIHDKLPDFGADDNLVLALVYSEKFEELEKELGTLPASTVRNQLRLVATTALQGVPAAVAMAGRLAAGQDQRFTLLNGAAEYLLRLRHYELTAALLSEAARGRDDAATVMARANVIARAKPFEKSLAPADDPRNIVQQLVLRVSGVNSRPLDTFFSIHVMPVRGFDKEALDSFTHTRNATRRTLGSLGLPLEVILDLGMANMQFTTEGSPDSGYRITMQVPGQKTETYYVVREGSECRIVSSAHGTSSLLAYALWRLGQGDLVGARHWLDWAREEIKPGGGDDALAGPLFPHFWNRGQQGDAEAVRLATAVGLAQSDQTEEVLPLLLRFRETVPEAQRLYLDYALAQAYAKLKKYAELHAVALRLATANPDSPAALSMLVLADQALGKNDAAPLLEQRLRRYPNDREALASLASLAARRGDFKAAADYEHQLIAAGRATPADFNGYGWNLLLAGQANEEVERLVERSAQLNKQDAPLLHTLAAIYAENGKTREARELLLKCMEVWGLDEPNGAIWYVYARIAEQYGLEGPAIDAYKRVEAPAAAWMENGTSYSLAKRRLAALKPQPKSPRPTK